MYQHQIFLIVEEYGFEDLVRLIAYSLEASAQ